MITPRTTRIMARANPDVAVFLAVWRTAVKMWAYVGKPGQPPSSARRRRIARAVKTCRETLRRFLAGDLLDQVDDAPPQLRVVDAHESLGQREPVRRCEKVRHVGRRWCVLAGRSSAGEIGCALEEESDRNLQDVGNLLQPAGADPIG